MPQISQSQEHVIVMGAGLTGCSTALELAARDVKVTLIERFSAPMLGAAATNEGKIHLGYIYAADESFLTAELQLRGALTFSSLLRRWCGQDVTKALGISRPFVYLKDQESLMSADALADHYARVDERCGTILRQFPELDYLGKASLEPVRALDRDSLDRWFKLRNDETGYQTAELAIDPSALARSITAAIKSHPLITLKTNSEIFDISRVSDGFCVTASCCQKSVKWRAPTIVNCLWENRLQFDQAMGISLAPHHVHRLKYRVVADCPEALRKGPSATRVLGRFGDVVVWPAGKVYLSWYPAGLQGWTNEVSPPRDWQGPMLGNVPQEDAQAIATETLDGIEAWYPNVKDCTNLSVAAGAILAWGQEDVDHHNSGLHSRSKIGSEHNSGYWSVEPGKLTTAPLAAFECVENIMALTKGSALHESGLGDRLLDRIQRFGIHSTRSGVT